jgi:hypothetical protein
MGDSINVGFQVVGENKKPNQLPKMRDPDRQHIAERLMGSDMPQEVLSELLRRLQNYPDGALAAFWSKLPGMIETLKLQKAKNEL